MALTPGTRLGPYAITAQIGVGGMGEVWCATDTNLGRQVAIKILPDAFAHDPERLARFEREAKTLASLNHPNIAIIHGLEKADGIRALVMELVEGPTLADRIGRGPIPIDEALPIAKQIAEALEAAHELGIIHRDFKPANIKVRPDGTVKVLDFGLAKAMEPEFGSSANVSMSPTITSPAMTQAGMILGTAAYMSPEQARGKTVDKRADIWAFGVVLYEMLTGTRLFAADSVPETLGLIFSHELDLALLPAATPARIRTLITRCLVKDPRQRLRDIGDARLGLEPAHDGPALATPTPVRSVWGALPWGLAAAAVLLAGWMFWGRPYLSAPQDVRDEVRFEVTTPPTADPTSFAISPDGKTLVFEATSGGKSRLWLRSLDAVPARQLAGTEDATSPFWSPDSRVVGFSANGQVKGIDIDTGTLQSLARSGDWNQDGAILFNRGGGGPIYRVAATGGEPTAVTPILQGSDQLRPQFLPDDRHFLFTAQGPMPGVYVALLGGSDAPRRIINDAGVGAYSSGYLLFVRQGTLFAQRFDPGRLQLEGREFVIADQVVTAGGRSFALSASEAGPIAYRTGPSMQAQFTWFDRSGTPLQTLAGSDIASVLNSSLSPDGRHLAFSRNVGGEAADIWLLDVRRGIPIRFTDDPAFELVPIWSPDSRRIAYGSNRNGRFDLYMKSADRTGSEVLLAGGEIGPPSDWSRDGRFILAQREAGQQQDIWAVSVDDRTSFPVVETKTFVESGGQFSPDGKWITFQSNESGQFEIYIQSFPGPGTRSRISNDGGVQARWREDGNELVYVAPDNRLMAVPIQLDAKGGSVDAGRPFPLFVTRLPMFPAIFNARHYMMSGDGQKFLVQTAKEVTLPITVILNLKPRS